MPDTASAKRQPIAIRIADAHIGIWQDKPDDASFRSEIFGALIRDMRARGWSIHEDAEIRKRFNILRHDKWRGAKGTLCCKIDLSGRVVQVDFWSVTAPQINHHGREHDFNKMRRMGHIDRLRIELEYRRAIRWVETLAEVTVTRADDGDMPAMARIEKAYAESWHSDKLLGRPVCSSDYNRQSKDGVLLEHGQAVWITDGKGRIIRGTAYYNINNMWWVVAGGKLYNEGSRSIYASVPSDLRTKRNERARRVCLERELSVAVQRMHFNRAQLIKDLLFGREQVFMIWARDNKAYYRSQYGGYTTEMIHAGKYTRAEAEAECRRVPHELEMVCPDGSRVRFDAREA